MLKQIERLGDRMVGLVARPVKAEAAAASCYNQYCCCVGCSFWQDMIRYDRICNGVYQYSWERPCGSCAA